MIKQLTLLSFLLLLAGIAQAACTWPGASQLGPNTPWAVGPNLYWAVYYNPDIGTAIYAARDAWDATDAANKIGDWSGVETDSDCPSGQPLQLGFYSFSTGGCPTSAAYQAGATTPGFIDYDPAKCPTCGTRSLSFNSDLVWSLNPLPAQYDIQSIATHEFGHLLGLNHMRDGFCSPFAGSPSCTTPNKNPGTMEPDYFQGDTCWRSLEASDIGAANEYY